MIVTFIIVSAQQIGIPLFIFSESVFENYSQCFAYVQKNSMDIYTKAASNYNCVTLNTNQKLYFVLTNEQ